VNPIISLGSVSRAICPQKRYHCFSADFQEHHPFEAILGVLNQLNALKRYLYFCNGGKVLD